MLSRAELERITLLAIDIIVLSDETYEPFVFDGRHISIASLPGMRDQTITPIGSVSKVFNVARLGAWAPS